MAFTEQVATLYDFLQKLVPGNLLPLATTALADALQRFEDPFGRILLGNGGIAPSARSGASG